MVLNYDKKYFHKQQGPNECWFASFLMVKDMVNKPETKSDYGTEKNWFINNRNIVADVNVARSLFQTGADDIVLNQLLKEAVDAHYETGYNADINLIRNGLNTGYPVIIGLNYQSGGHYCVVIGVDTEKNRITIIDPLGNGDPREIDMPGSCNIQYYKA